MKHTPILLATIFSLLWLWPSAATNQDTDPVKQLQWVINAKPELDAKAALKSNIYTLLAISGYTWTLPGTDNRNKLDYETKYGITILKGTSDAITNEEHLSLIAKATKYAEKYNQFVLNSLVQH
jgi:hypothetical protein